MSVLPLCKHFLMFFFYIRRKISSAQHIPAAQNILRGGQRRIVTGINVAEFCNRTYVGLEFEFELGHWSHFPCHHFILSCEVHTANTIVTPAHRHSLNIQRDRGNYNFDLRLADLCNMLATAEPATITPYTVPDTHDQYLKEMGTKGHD